MGNGGSDVAEVARQSKKDCRVYVGNLSYEVRSEDLSDFMRDGASGKVVHAEVLLLPNGYSKGCGIVEFSHPEDAQKAITQLSDTDLKGRPVFIREDRENEARYGAPPSRGNFRGFGGHGGYGAPPPPPAAAPGAQLYIGNLPYSAGWQDLKDMFRAAGNVVRADINIGPDGRSKGSGIVVFANPEDAQNAISQFNGTDWNGRPIEVREDRFAGSAGGFGFGGASERNLPPAEPSQQIFVKNLPWSTSNEDLVELFQTTGKVDEAEVLIEGTRSKGVGVVQFASISDAETSIAKFQGYVYGGRALDIEYNRSWRDFRSGGHVNDVQMS
ncbi:uncharacterized protein FA14DRAFT_122073 [Meira miltonrushii]|uniref:RRM domain-containing protein n=1 Tax=Meira miltonrushii TaxID=1280837 RepID=A0A316VEG0_9BASI|nr:uncharacterized protein FA14DRAFT_122073 [Meira miltonrushii]PWN35972.1 hypothetical protein FA14DRAFT_122073 [Meira miltonrushii]